MKKNMELDLKPGLQISIGLGTIQLFKQNIEKDGLDKWILAYRVKQKSPVTDTYCLPAQIVRALLKSETLERECKTRYEYGRRYFNRCNELNEQLTKSENLRDVANKTNKERIDELEMDKVRLNADANEYKSNFEKLDKIALMEMTKNEKSEKLIDKLRFNNFMLWASTLCFFALWLIALYF